MGAWRLHRLGRRSATLLLVGRREFRGPRFGWREVGSRDVKFEPTDPALGPKSGPVRLLHDLYASCWDQLGSE